MVNAIRWMKLRVQWALIAARVASQYAPDQDCEHGQSLRPREVLAAQVEGDL
jgi:hypothetical protein